MSMRYPGGLIATSPVNARYPSGVWTQAQTAPYQAQNVWTRDRFWPNTTLLLQGDGAVNGAQNNTFLDSSSNNFTITRNGNTTQGAFTPYEPEGYWSNYFDGSGDYLTVPSNTALNLGSGDFTIEVFWYPTAFSTDDALVMMGTSAGSFCFALYNNSTGGGVIALAGTGGGSWDILSGLTVGTAVLNQWNHVVLTRSGTTFSTYMNGVRGGTQTSSSALGSADLGIAANSTGGSGLSAGYLSNLRILKGTSLYSGTTITVPTAPLTAITNTSLLTCQSNRFKDNSTNNFTLTVNGNPSVQAFQPFPGATTWSASVLGGSAYLDGSGDYLLTTGAGALAIGTSAFTLEGWVYFNNVNTDGAGFGTCAVAADASTDRGVSLFITNPSGAWRFRIGRSFAGQFEDFLGTTTLTSGQWYHFKIVRTSTATNDTRVYLNGVQEAVGTSTISLNMQKFAVGIYSPSDATVAPLNGYVAGVRFTNTAVSSAVPTSPVTAISGTQYLANFTNAGIYDNSMMNNLETVGNAQVSTSVVKYGTGSMAFDGTGDYLTLLSTQLLTWGTGDFTIEMWVNTSTTSVSGGASRTMWGTSSASYQGQMYLEIGTGKVVFGNTGSTFIKGSKNVADGAWHHIAVCRNGTTCRLFVDGVQDASGTNSVNYDAQVTYVGAFGPSDGYFNGYIDDLRITKGAARYITNFTPPPARLPAQ